MTALRAPEPHPHPDPRGPLPGLHEQPVVGVELMVLVYRQMRILAGQHPDLDDLVQCALEQIISARFRGDSKFSTFSYSICYRVWLKHLRLIYRFARLFELGSDVESPSQDNALADISRKERHRRLYQALDRVAPKRRATVLLHDISGMDVEEIAEVCGVNVHTVWSRLRDGRKQLARHLRNDPYFGEDLWEEDQ